MELPDPPVNAETCHIVFNINYGGLAGLGATLISMIEYCEQPQRLMLHVMCSDLADEHKTNIDRILTDAGFAGGHRYLDYDANQEFRNLPTLLGDLTAYGRLLIPGLLEESKAVYLDSDLVVACDVTELYDTQMGNALIGAVTRGQVNTALDRKYFLDRGVPPTMPYFNSGVLLMNLDKWRKENVDVRWRKLLAGDVSELRSHDQTTLNFLCRGDFLQLPISYNTPFLAHQPKEGRQSGILHFIGSPKPWDFLGSIIHQGYGLWKKHNPTFWSRQYLKFDAKRLRRSWQIRRSLVRSAISRVKG